jgi:hypothetical protein
MSGRLWLGVGLWGIALLGCGGGETGGASKPDTDSSGARAEADGAHRLDAGDAAPFEARKAQLAQTSLSYRGDDGRTYEAKVFVPTAPGRYPLFLWIPGTNEAFDAPVALHIAHTMAERGVIAATVSYNNTFAGPWSCASYDGRARALLDASRSTSFISRLQASLPAFDSAKGIVLGGHSLGAWIAGRGADVSPHVRAAWLLGAGYKAFGVMDLCLRAEQTKLLRVRVVNGEHDTVYGGTRSSNLEQVAAVAGVASSWNGVSRFDDGGNGYALVLDDDVPASRTAEHFYFIADCDVGRFCDPRRAKPQPDWDGTDAPWGRMANQSWLMRWLGPEQGR